MTANLLEYGNARALRILLAALKKIGKAFYKRNKSWFPTFASLQAAGPNLNRPANIVRSAKACLYSSK